MNCIEARRMVTPFINKELSDKETEQFLKHIEHCSDCMDELDIYFTVYRALDTLDSGTHQEYDFRKMMQEEIRSVRRGIFARKVFRIFRNAVLVVAELLLVLSVYTGYEMQKGEVEHSTLQRAIERLTYRNALDNPPYELPETELGTEAGPFAMPEEEAGPLVMPENEAGPLVVPKSEVRPPAVPKSGGNSFDIPQDAE